MSLKSERRRAGYSAREAGEELGVSKTTVYMWESGKSSPNIKKLPEIANLYGCTIDDLFKERTKSNDPYRNQYTRS